MKQLTAILLLTLVLVFPGASTSQAQTTGDFRSYQTGNWNATSTWQTWNGSSWVSATSTPSGAAGVTITIQSGHTVTVNVAVSISGTLVNSRNHYPKQHPDFRLGRNVPA